MAFGAGLPASVGGTVGTAEIDDAAVTLAKMADLAADTMIGRANGAGTGVPQALTLAQALALLGGGSAPTGTGLIVRQTSPTFVTPALGTPASGVATNLTGTAAGLTAGDATKVANTTPGAGGLALLDDASADANLTTLGLPTSFALGDQRVLRSRLISNGLLLLTTDTGYFVFLGTYERAVTVTHVEFAVTTGGAGTQAAEVALYSSPLPPNKAGQTLTRLGAGTATVDDLTTTGVKRNTSSLAQAVSAGTNLWAALRTAMSVTPPTIAALARDYAQGLILSQATPGALTSLSSATGAIITHAITNQCPDLTVVLD